MILIVDDKPENIFSLEVTLQSKGFKTDAALSGEEALKKSLKNDYALIILDVQMPEMDGFEVAETLTGINKTKDIPIIFLTAVNKEKKFIAKGYASGGIDYIAKPVDPDILLLKVKTFYRLYEQTSTLQKMQKDLQKEVTQRKLAQEQLKLKFEEVNSILESLPQIAFTLDGKGTIEFVNQEWLKYSPNIASCPVIHPDDQGVLDTWSLHQELFEPFEKEIRLKKLHANSYRYHLLKMTPVFKQNNEIKWVGTLTDIDERKQLEKKKDEFLSVASHELKTPLTSIKAFSQIALRAMQDINEHKAYAYISKVKEQSEKLQSLVEDLLDISRLENVGLKLNIQKINIDDFLDKVLESIKMAYPNVEILHDRSSLNTIVRADALRIEQVINNYISNAVKYTPNCNEIILKTFVEGNNYRLEVSDNGVGIPHYQIPLVFDKFYRVEENSSRFQGLGLGLHICKEIIQQHGGECGASSVLGKGSTFYFTLPILS